MGDISFGMPSVTLKGNACFYFQAIGDMGGGKKAWRGFCNSPMCMYTLLHRFFWLMMEMPEQSRSQQEARGAITRSRKVHP